MIDVFDLYQAHLGNVNSQQGGHSRPHRNFQSWLCQINMELFREKFGSHEKSQRSHDELARPFLRTVNVVLETSSARQYDVARYPDDYAYFSSARVLLRDESATEGMCAPNTDFVSTGQLVRYEDPDMVNLRQRAAGDSYVERSVSMIDDQRWGNILTHKFLKPTLKKPAMTIHEGGFRVAPTGVGIVVLQYLRTPDDPVFAYTIGSDDMIIYNQAGSTQLEWPAQMRGEFLSRLSERYALYIRDGGLHSASVAERRNGM